MLDGSIEIIDALGCDWYDRHISEDLVNEIMRIQGDLPLEESDISEALRVLRLSPSALGNLLHPQARFVTHRYYQPYLRGGPIDTLDRSDFFTMIYRMLEEDYRAGGGFGRYFTKRRELSELEIKTEIIVKTKKGVELEGHVRERVRVVRPEWQPDGYGVIGVIHGEPEPWEEVDDDSSLADKDGV